MPDRLALTPDDRQVLATAAAAWHGGEGRTIPAAYIEKDFWVTETLRSLSKSLSFSVDGNQSGQVRARVVFKGGTSLSKAHGLIDRFSEDIDLYVVARFDRDADAPAAPGDAFSEDGVGRNRADRIFGLLAEQVAGDVGLEVAESGDKYARSGTRRAYEMAYAPEGDVPGALKPHVLIELTRMGNPEPNSPHNVRSLLAEYVLATGQAHEDEFAALAAVKIDVLMPHRTLVEKLCALEHCSQRAQADSTAFAQMSRHFYDVYQLLGAESVTESLLSEPGGTDGIAADHVQRSAEVRRATGPRPETGFADSLWITDDTVRAIAQESYDREVPPLLYGPAPGFDDVLRRMSEMAEVL